MQMKTIAVFGMVLSLASSTLAEVTPGTSVGAQDVSWADDDAVEITGVALPTKADHKLRRAYLEFQSDLPAGSHIELWWTDQSGAPWENGGEILDLWVMEEATGTQVRLNLAGWVKRSGTGKLYLREGIASYEDVSELDAESMSSMLVKSRFVKKSAS